MTVTNKNRIGGLENDKIIHACLLFGPRFGAAARVLGPVNRRDTRYAMREGGMGEQERPERVILELPRCLI